MRRRRLGSSPSSPHLPLNMLAKGSHDSLIAEGWIWEKPIDTGASVTIARSDIVTEQLKGKPSRPYILQMASRETNPVLKEALVELTLGQRHFGDVGVCHWDHRPVLCEPKTRQWTSGTMCHDWAAKCCCGDTQHDHDHPGLLWPAMR
jgi:hypothetical protein